MGIGDVIKDAVDALRDDLGTDCTLIRSGSETALGACSFEDYTPSRAESILGPDYEDEIGNPWAMIEVPIGHSIVAGDKLRMAGKDWIVRRPIAARGGGVEIAQRCLCIGKLVT